jgi:hypothetical protein
MRARGVGALLVLALLMAGALHLIGPNATDPTEARRARAIAWMVSGLVGLWALLAGGLMWRFRPAIVVAVRAIPLQWQVKFVLFATALACLEEAVTVTMTNLAPLFGSRIGEAYITASTNWLDVIALHSVVVFVPFFIALAVILRRWDASPLAVFLAFGVVGTLAEAIFAASPAALAMFPIWVFVYGLMVWLPACSLPPDRGARTVGRLALASLPIVTLALALPLIAPLVWLISGVLGHPAIDFAP